MREYVASRFDLQEMLKGVLHRDRRWYRSVTDLYKERKNTGEKISEHK